MVTYSNKMSHLDSKNQSNNARALALSCAENARSWGYSETIKHWVITVWIPASPFPQSHMLYCYHTQGKHLCSSHNKHKSPSSKNQQDTNQFTKRLKFLFYLYELKENGRASLINVLQSFLLSYSVTGSTDKSICLCIDYSWEVTAGGIMSKHLDFSHAYRKDPARHRHERCKVRQGHSMNDTLMYVEQRESDRLALLAACCLFLFWRIFRMFFQDTIKGNEVRSKLLSLTRNEFLPKSINTTVLWNGMSHIPNWSLTHPVEIWQQATITHRRNTYHDCL